MKTKIQYISDEFKYVVETLINNDYKVLINPNRTVNYIHFSDGVRIGHIQQENKYRAITTSSTHKPCREAGTGFRVCENITKENLIKEIKKTLETTCPDWFKDKGKIKKYTDFNDFFNSYWDKNAVVL